MNSAYVHLYTDALADIPLLARGSNAVVFVAIGILLPEHPEGANIHELIQATALSARTIQAALTLLISSGLVIETSDGKFTPVKHIEYRRNTNNVQRGTDRFIYQSSNQSIGESKSNVFTEKENNQYNTRANYYAEYQAAFGELAQTRSAQMLEAIERIEPFGAEWVREAFRRTAEKETEGGEIWQEWRRAPYALRILENWKRAGGIQETKPKASQNAERVEVVL